MKPKTIIGTREWALHKIDQAADDLKSAKSALKHGRLATFRKKIVMVGLRMRLIRRGWWGKR